MTPDTLATVTILGAILAFTLALVLLITHAGARLERRLERYELGQAKLLECMVRLEGLLERFTVRRQGGVSNAASGPL